MKWTSLGLPLCVLILSTTARAGEPVPGPVPTHVVPSASPCPGGAPCLHTTCCPTECGSRRWFDFDGSIDWQHLREWACYRPARTSCGGKTCGTCPPSPYVFFLGRTRPRCGECPPAPPACDSCDGHAHRPIREWVKSHRPEGGWLSLPSFGGLFGRGDCYPAESCPQDTCSSPGMFSRLKSSLGW